MTTQDRIDKQQEHKRFHWLRLVIFFIALLFFIGAAIVWYVHLNWSPILTIIFAVLGITLSLGAWVFPISPIQSDTSKYGDTTYLSHHSPINVNVSQQISLSPNQITPLEATPEKTSNPHKGIESPLSLHSTDDQLDRDTIIESSKTLSGEMQTPDWAKGKSMLEPDSVFLFNVPLTDPIEFYGRTRERSKLINRIRQEASTSIVGPRRIGKTWLISYLMLVAPHELGSRFNIGYLDATAPSCETIAGFTSIALEELGAPIVDRSNLGLDKLEKIVRDQKSRNRISVLCIDEFEGLTNKQAFDLNFFVELRAITQAGLTLIVASRHRLIDIVKESPKSSPFFNFFEQLTLNPFTTIEAQEFVKAKGSRAGFTEQEQHYLLTFGQEEREQGWFPLHLQLAGKLLLEGKRYDSEHYHPDDPEYWWEFKRRLEETYRGVVR